MAGIWEGSGLEIIRDLYTKASQGIVLTGVMLWDAYTALRTGAYKRVGIQLT